MSRLEKFIKSNRPEFDDQEPGDRVWRRVHEGLDKKNDHRLSSVSFLRWSAAAAVLLLTGIAIFMKVNQTMVQPTHARLTDTSVAEPATVAPGEALAMNQFARMILTKQEELKILSAEQPDLYKKFEKDFRQLDSSYNTLKNKLSVTPNRELLIEAMIQNLQLQLNVLNQQLNIIHQIKQSKKYSHEKNTSFT